MRITANHPIRREIAGLPTYVEDKAEIAHLVDTVCRRHGVDVVLSDMDGDEGHANFVMRTADEECIRCDHCDAVFAAPVYDNFVVVYWYRMPSGRYELTAYVS